MRRMKHEGPWKTLDEIEYIDSLPPYQLEPYRQGLLKRVEFDGMNPDLLFARVDRRLGKYVKPSKDSGLNED